MKKYVGVVLALLLAGVLGFSGSAQAGWVDMHGHDGVVEAPGYTTGVYFRTYGLQFYQKPGLANQVHFEIPTTDSARKVRYIWVQYYTSSANAQLRTLYVYSGNTLVRALSLPTTATVGWKTRVFDLGATYTIGLGLGVSFYLTNVTTTTQIVFGGVAANLIL